MGTHIMIGGVLFGVVGTFDDPGNRWENKNGGSALFYC